MRKKRKTLRTRTSREICADSLMMETRRKKKAKEVQAAAGVILRKNWSIIVKSAVSFLCPLLLTDILPSVTTVILAACLCSIAALMLVFSSFEVKVFRKKSLLHRTDLVTAQRLCCFRTTVSKELLLLWVSTMCLLWNGICNHVFAF